MPDAEECSRCGQSGTELDIIACPICFKGACRHCAINVSGRSFCSQACAEYFFHGDEDEAGHEE